MYKTIIMPVDVFEMELSDKAVRHAEFLAQQDGIIHLLHVLPGSSSFTMSRFTADLRRFEEHLQHEAETRLTTMAGHFSIDPHALKSTYASATCGTWLTSWPTKLKPTWWSLAHAIRLSAPICSVLTPRALFATRIFR